MTKLLLSGFLKGFENLRATQHFEVHTHLCFPGLPVLGAHGRGVLYLRQNCLTGTRTVTS